MPKTILEKILERRVKPSPNSRLSRSAIEEGEVAVAWVTGKIDSAEAVLGLDVKQTSQVHQKVGTLLRNLATGGYISIAWNPPIEESEQLSEALPESSPAMLATGGKQGMLVIVKRENGKMEPIELDGSIDVFEGDFLNRLIDRGDGKEYFFTKDGHYDGWGQLA